MRFRLQNTWYKTTWYNFSGKPVGYGISLCVLLIEEIVVGVPLDVNLFDHLINPVL